MAETSTVSTAASPEMGNAKAFPPLDPQTFVPQLVWLALTFGLLYVLLKRFALPRVGGVIKERQDRIRGDLDQAAKLKAEIEEALASYEQALIEARDRGRAIAMDMRDKLMGELNSERAKGEAQIAQKLADAEARIMQTKAKALANVGDIAADATAAIVAIVAKLIGKQVTNEEVRRALVKRAAE